jgi:hypothetical protein
VWIGGGGYLRRGKRIRGERFESVRETHIKARRIETHIKARRAAPHTEVSYRGPLMHMPTYKDE